MIGFDPAAVLPSLALGPLYPPLSGSEDGSGDEAEQGSDEDSSSDDDDW
jgi:hypothetical protein